MTQNMAHKPQNPLDQLDIVEAERAAVDLRRGLPVVVCGETRAILALAPETTVPATYEAALGWAAKHAKPLVALTPERAETLRIRLYTDKAIAVTLPIEGEGKDILDRAAVLADPSEDLNHAMGGPYAALRDLEGRPLWAAVKLAKIAGLLPSVLTLDLPGPTDASAFAHDHRLSMVNAAALLGYDLGITDALSLVTRAKVPLEDATKSEMLVFRSSAGGPEHYAILVGDPDATKPVMARIHSECFTGDLLGSLKCDCGDQLRGALKEISARGTGVLLYLAQEGRGIGLPNKLRAYRLQDQGFDTVDANTRLGFEVDERFFHPAAQMLKLMGIGEVKLMTNNPDKVEALKSLGVQVTKMVPHAFPTNAHNEHYLLTKKTRTGHKL